MAKQTFTTGQVLTAAQMTSLQQTAMGGGAATAKTASYVLVAADAGTTVAMNAVGSTTITVNTGLFSAGDTIFIQNWGAGTCTITAGTATVTTHGSLALSQWEGGQLYFTSSSAAIFFDISQSSGMTNPMTTTGDTIYGGASGTPTRLGIGSTGQVLTVAGGVPSWATPSVPVSKVVQIVAATTSTDTASSSITFADTTLTATITPTSASNKVLVFVNQNGLQKTSADSQNAIDINLVRGSTNIASFAQSVGYTNSSLQLWPGTASISYLDSPATTSATTYKTQFRNPNNSAQISVQKSGTVSSIVLMEVTP